IRRLRLLLDFDPTRPDKNTSSTDAEKAAALALAIQVREYLTGRGWPAPILGDSGNGYHLVYGINLPNDNPSTWLVEWVLKGLDRRFSSSAVKVDTSVYNAGRISKLYGTMACKGPNTPDRPHRLTRIVEAPDLLGPVFMASVSTVLLNELLDELKDKGEDTSAAAAAPLPAAAPRPTAPTGTPFDVDHYLHEHHIGVKRDEPYDGGRRWILKTCPFNPDHGKGSDTAILQLVSGAVVFKCQHDGCAETTWRDYREAVEGKPTISAHTALSAQGDTKSTTGQTNLSTLNTLSMPWPEKLSVEAMHGITGAFVREVAPHTEADEAALLVQFLVAAGCALGPGPHMMVGADRHTTRLFAVLVGTTSRGRKGSSEGWVRRIVADSTPGWGEHVVGGLSTGEGLIWTVRDPIYEYQTTKARKGEPAGEPQLVMTDPGIDDKRLMIVESEYARLLKVAERDGNTVSPIIRQAWDSGDLRVMTRSSPAVATGAHISIIGHVSEEQLERLRA
ncbi:MAG TPA: hypothetical protein PK435_16540, partial [Thermoanaerobaculaceae bacterium]|nr:hypothetical protein [Thermoanaerobaculaceae bacterium]